MVSTWSLGAWGCKGFGVQSDEISGLGLKALDLGLGASRV